MAERNIESSSRFDLKKGLDIAATVIGLLAPAAIFYAVGYVITQAYVIIVGLNGTFWFNEFFYREAGARFALDIVAAVMLLPHVFLLLSAALFLFFPTAGEASWRDRLFRKQSPDSSLALPATRLPRFVPAMPRWLRICLFMGIITAALGSVVFLVQLAAAELDEVPVLDLAQRIRGSERVFADYWLLPEEIRRHYFEAKPSLYVTSIFLSVTVPLLVAFAGLAYRAFRRTEVAGGAARPAESVRRHARHALGTLWLVATVMLGGYVAVAYGALFYDFTAVKVIDEDKCLPLGKDDAAKRDESTILQCYLVGRFDKWYILLGWEKRKNDKLIQPPIYVKQVDSLEPFSILTGPGSPVRGILRNVPLSLDVAPEQSGSYEPTLNLNSANPRAAEQRQEKLEVRK